MDTSFPALPPAPGAATQEASVDDLADFLGQHRKIWVLTGAGISHGSGIPTYRDHDGKWQHSDPIRHQEYISNPASRRRYWARSVVGWQRVHDASPNSAHAALARLEKQHRIFQVVTQNVDGLHQAAGSKAVIDLHGRLDRNICMNCGQSSNRAEYQAALEYANPEFGDIVARSLPDGDAEVEDSLINDFVIPASSCCGGIVKPDVVFFGDSVAPAVVAQAFDSMARADAVLLVGTSLQVWSGYRFSKKAHEMNIPIASINIGVSRADELLGIKLRADCCVALPRLAERLISSAIR